jgi:hypothetical protein
MREQVVLELEYYWYNNLHKFILYFCNLHGVGAHHQFTGGEVNQVPPFPCEKNRKWGAFYIYIYIS